VTAKENARSAVEDCTHLDLFLVVVIVVLLLLFFLKLEWLKANSLTRRISR
jgi:hypothetical protein